MSFDDAVEALPLEAICKDACVETVLPLRMQVELSRLAIRPLLLVTVPSLLEFVGTSFAAVQVRINDLVSVSLSGLCIVKSRSIVLLHHARRLTSL